MRPLGFWKVGIVYRNAGFVSVERLEDEAVVVHGHSHDLGPEAVEDLQRPVVRRRLDQHALVVAAQQVLPEEGETL